MNTKQQRALAWEAFQAGVSNGGDSSPGDSDHEAIQASVAIAFDRWWERRLRAKRSAG